MKAVVFRECGANSHPAFKSAFTFCGQYLLPFPYWTPGIMTTKDAQQRWADDRLRHLMTWANANANVIEIPAIRSRVPLHIEKQDRIQIQMGGYTYTGSVTSSQMVSNVPEQLGGKFVYYVEWTEDNYGPGYWKQDQDGGKIISVNGEKVA